MRSAKVIKEASTTQPSIAEIADRLIENEENARGSFDGSHSTSTVKPQPSKSAKRKPTPTTADEAKALRRKTLGELLRYAAALSEAMDSHVDEQLVHEYVHSDPPLHPRRTLDQSYYGALKNTHTRDRDQVVYRATTPTPHRCRKGPNRSACQDCKAEIKKTPRVIMVDQLWMWILDESVWSGSLFKALADKIYRDNHHKFSAKMGQE